MVSRTLVVDEAQNQTWDSAKPLALAKICRISSSPASRDTPTSPSRTMALPIGGQLNRFKRQYIQLLDPGLLDWPRANSLKDPDVQAWMYRNLFSIDALRFHPPERYQLRVLKQLTSTIEQAIVDPEEDVCLFPFVRWANAKLAPLLAIYNIY